MLPKVSLTAFVNGWLVDTLGPTKVTIISGEGRFFWVNIYHIGDTKSAQELEVFLRMPREWLRFLFHLIFWDRS